MDRRTVLALLGGGLALALGGSALRLTTGYAVGPGDVPLSLTVKQFAIVHAVVEALLPADGALPSGLALGLPQQVDEAVFGMSDEQREAFGSALAALEMAPLLLGFGGRLSRLLPEERVAALDHVAAAGPRRLAQAVVGVKQLVHLLYYASDATWGAIGYDGPLVATPKPPPSAMAYRALLDARSAP